MKKKSRASVDADKYIGERIRAARKVAGVSQAELGDALGISFQQVQKYEKGTNRISCGALVRIAAALKQDVVWFFEGCPGIAETRRETKEASTFNTFFREPGATDLAADFVRLPPKMRTALRDLASVL